MRASHISSSLTHCLPPPHFFFSHGFLIFSVLLICIDLSDSLFFFLTGFLFTSISLLLLPPPPTSPFTWVYIVPYHPDLYLFLFLMADISFDFTSPPPFFNPISWVSYLSLRSLSLAIYLYVSPRSFIAFLAPLAVSVFLSPCRSIFYPPPPPYPESLSLSHS